MGSRVRTHHRGRGTRLVVVTAVTLGLVAAACGSDSKKSETTNATAAPTTAAVTTAAPATTAGGGSSPASSAVTTAAPATTATATTAPGETPKPGGELIMAGDAEVANPWTPAAMQCDPYCYQRARTFFDQLAVVANDHKVHPYLAESLTPNADSSQWTIKLRPNVNFSDGTPVNADAVMRNLNETGSSLLVAKSLVDVARNADGTMKMDKLDDLTFTMYMGKGGDPTKPLSWPNFPINLTGQFGLIASPKWLDEVKADPTKASMPVGSGPFIVQSYAPRDALVVTRNPNYWLKDDNGVQLPYLDKVTFRVIEDAKTSEEALVAGDIDIFSTSRTQVIADMREKTSDFGLLEQNNFGETNYLLIDLSKETPLQDQRVRCALSMAIDRQEVNDLVGAGLPEIANGLFSPGQEGYLEDNGLDTTQNLDEAKKLIEAYKTEKGIDKIEFKLGSTVDTLTQQSDELIIGYWKEIGVDATMDVVPQDQYITNALFGVPTFLMYPWRSHSGYVIDSQNLWWNSSSSAPDGQLALNFGRLQDPDVDANLAIARSDPDPAKRKAAAEEVNRIFAKNCYQIPLSWAIWGTSFKNDVKGISQAAAPDGTVYLDEGKTSNGGVVPMAYMWLDNG